ncbi:hypothetical protein BST61_g6826 [Cercospora zeina]
MSANGDREGNSAETQPTLGTKRRGENLDEQYVAYTRAQAEHIEDTQMKMERIREDRALGLRFIHCQTQLQGRGSLQEQDGSWSQAVVQGQRMDKKSEGKDNDGDSKMGNGGM